VYFNYCETNNIPFDKPYFKSEEGTPIIPTTESVNKIISGATTRFAVVFTILAETGIEGAELEKISRKQIDAEQGIVSVKGCKGHDSGTYKLKQATTDMLRLYLAKNPQEYPFPKARIMGEVWRDTRTRVANKLSQPDLKNIPLRNLRNYAGAKLWYATQDPIAVMRLLRHKKLDTTMHYIRGVTTSTGDCDFTCKAATNAKEAMTLIEAGFQYVTTIEGIQLFKKRKLHYLLFLYWTKF
jgi:integrase